MKIISRELAVEKGYVKPDRYREGVWVTWRRTSPNRGHMPRIYNIYDDEITAMRAAVVKELSVAFVPYGHGYDYLDDADLDQLPQADPPT